MIEPTHENVGALVPKEPEAKPSDFNIGESLSKWIKDKLWAQCEKLNEPDWRRHKKNMLRCRKYFDGEQYGTVNDRLEWFNYEKRAGEINYVQNEYAPHINTALMEMSRGETRLNFAYATEESRKGELVAKIAESRYKIHKQKSFNPAKMTQENLSLLLNGVALRYTYVKWEEGKQKIPKFGEQEEAGDSAIVCAMCGSPRTEKPEAAEPIEPDEMNPAHEMAEGEGKHSDADECPNCGSSEVQTISANFKSKVITGYENGKKATIEWCSPDPMGILFDIHAATLKESSYLIWKQAVLMSVLQAKFPKSKLAEGIQSQELRDQYSQGAATPNSQMMAMAGEGADKQLTEFEQGWFDSVLYQNYKLTENVTLRSGATIPAGTKLIDVFPDGLYVAKSGDVILDLWNEDKCDKWTCAPYVARLGTLVGAGTSVILDGQDRLNDIINLQFQSILNDSFRKEFINGQYLSNDEIPNDPRERAVINSLPEGGRIVGNVIDALPPSPLTADAYQVPETIKGSMQNQLGTFSASSSGMPDLKAAQNTASGMELFRDLTVGRFYPMLSVRADCLDKEQAYQLLLNDQKTLTPEQWAKYAGDYGQEAVQAFLECDLREDLLITVVPESFMPQTPSQKLMKTTGFYQFVAQIPPGTLDKESLAHVSTQFGMPQSIMGFDAVYSVAMEHISVFGEIAEQIVSELGDVPTYDLNNPETFQMAGLVLASANIPIVPEMDDTEVLINAIQDFWRKDAGRNASNLLKAVLTLRVEELKQGVAMNAAADAQLALAAQQPVMDQQAAQAEEQAMQQQAQQEQQMGAANEQQMMQMEAEAAKGEQDKEFQASMKMADMTEAEKQRAHEREMAMMQQNAAQ